MQVAWQKVGFVLSVFNINILQYAEIFLYLIFDEMCCEGEFDPGMTYEGTVVDKFRLYIEHVEFELMTDYQALSCV